LRFLRGFGRFWWDFIVGEDWRIAAGVTLVLAGAALLVSQTDASNAVVAIVAAVGVAAVAIGAILRSARPR
jgi:hypothetical protein